MPWECKWLRYSELAHFDALIWPPCNPQPATLISAGKRDREGWLHRRTKVELFEEIRREYEHGAGTIKGVAKKLGVHRRMVREAVGSAVPRPRKIPERQRPKLTAAIPFIDEVLEADRKVHRKQRHTARRIFHRLRREKPEIAVAESTVREYVRLRKTEMGLTGREIFIPQSYAWGSEGQVDWYEAYAEIDGQETMMNIFCLRSMAGGGAFHRAYPRATQQAFLEAHELAFAYFGGVFKILRYDNLKSAVQKILRGHQREETARFIAFRSHWGYESEFCNPASGNEKGGVEGEGGQFRRNRLVPVPKVRNLEELNELLLGGCRDDEGRVIEGRSQTVGAATITEREHLLPLVAEGFDLASRHSPAVDKSSCVKVLTNFYSVPLAAGLQVEAKVYAGYVEIWYRARLVARHERSFERFQKVLELDHYLDALVKKPGALAGSTPLEQCRLQGRWPAGYDEFWERLKQRQGRTKGTRGMIEVLLLGRELGQARVLGAVKEALRLGGAEVSLVRFLLQAEQRPVAEPVDVGVLREYDRPQPSMAGYDRLLPNRPVTEVLQ
jgi:transposase